MANTTADKLNRLNATKTAIKEAIISKGQSVSENDTFNSYAQKISNIQTGTDTSDATATADNLTFSRRNIGHGMWEDIPKTAYVNGVKLSGTILDNRDNDFDGPPIELQPPTQNDYELWNNKYGAYVKSRMYNMSPASGVVLTDQMDIKMAVNGRTMLNLVNFTADKLKSGEKLFGVTGTYDGGVAEALADSY